MRSPGQGDLDIRAARRGRKNLHNTFELWNNKRMRSETWWDYFDEDPYEKVGRYMPSALGHLVTFELDRVSWAYLDWLAAEDGCDIEKLFIDNDLIWRPEDGCRSSWMEGAVRKGYLWREKHGLPRPAWCPPANPAEYIDI